MNIQAGKSLFVRATGTTWYASSGLNATLQIISGNVKLSGNIMSLLTPFEEDFENKQTIDTAHAFTDIFKASGATIDAEELRLPATTLASSCYSNMFNGCTGLTIAPELPATTLASSCYSSMFYGCTGLTTAPELPATTLFDSCYSNMFNGCTGLTIAPELPATTLGVRCYSAMFKGCVSLATAPELPATTLAERCYYDMFNGCTGLTTAPELPATTLVNYCYNGMFYHCSSIAAVTILATDISATNCLLNWLASVANSGVLTKKSAMTSLPSGPSGIPHGWTVVNV